MRVWVTRAQPLALATAQRLAQMSHEPVVLPLIETRAVPIRAEDLAGAAALAFTSQTAVDALSAQGLVAQLAGIAVFTVGVATAEAARRAGFQNVQAGSGDVEALAALILSTTSPLPGAVVHLSARHPAGDLTGLLQAGGREARRVTVYETVPTGVRAAPTEIDAVLIHSAMAARAAAAVISQGAAENMWLLGLSEAALAPLNAIKFHQRAVAPFANEASILSLLDQCK